MTPEELYEWMRKELKEMRTLYCESTNALHKEIKNMTEPAPAGGRLYTAIDVIRIVQRTVSDEVCAMDANEAAIGYEIERSIIAELVKEDGCETNV